MMLKLIHLGIITSLAGHRRGGVPRNLPALDMVRVTVHAIARVAAGLPMPGLFAVQRLAAIGRVIPDLVLLAACSHEQEWEGQLQCLAVLTQHPRPTRES